MSKTITHWGKECKKQMIENGITLKKLGEHTGYTNTYLSAIINGRVIAPDDTLNKINKVLEIKELPASK